MSELQIKELHKKYGSNTVVQNLNITVKSGEMLSLLGPSGCGKTTTLRMIAGMQTPTSGKILLADKDLTHVAPHKRNVGLVFQNYALFPHLNVFDNVAFGLRRHGVPKAEIEARVMSGLKSVQLTDYAKRFPSQLSGGQQQRVALARTLVLKPPLVLFDEPLSNLDAKLRQALGIEIRALQRQFGFTGIFVTHDQEEAMLISDRIAVMHGGCIKQIGAPEEIYMNPIDPFVAEFVGESNLLRIVECQTVYDHWKMKLASGQIIIGPKANQTEIVQTAMIRPEAVKVYSKEEADRSVEDSSKFNHLEGTIAYIHYTGASYVVGIHVQGLDKPFMVRIPNAKKHLSLQMGDEAIIQWPISATLVY